MSSEQIINSLTSAVKIAKGQALVQAADLLEQMDIDKGKPITLSQCALILRVVAEQEYGVTK